MKVNKYRAWDKKENKMYYNVQDTYDYMCNGKGCLEENFSDVLEDDKYIVMQYINLNDKNKTEMYEGDIAKRIDFLPIVDRFGREDIGVIKYVNGSYFLICKDCKYLISADFNENTFCKPSYEIIGNECEDFILMERIKIELSMPVKLPPTINSIY